MTVEELINNLQSYPINARVVVAGYEDGYNDIDIMQQISIKLNANRKWYCGAHQESNKINAVTAILLAGENKNSKDDSL